MSMESFQSKRYLLENMWANCWWLIRIVSERYLLVVSLHHLPSKRYLLENVCLQQIHLRGSNIDERNGNVREMVKGKSNQ